MKQSRKFSPVAVVLIVGLTLSACTTAQIASFNQSVASIEAKIAAFIAKVKQNYPVVLQDAQNTVDLACGIVPSVRTTITNFSGSISNPSAKVQAALDAAIKYAATAQASCDSYNAQKSSGTSPTLSQTINFGISIWNAYQAGKTEYQKATAAAASGS